jgi:Mg/Co/Ni transporter MgtE
MLQFNSKQASELFNKLEVEQRRDLFDKMAPDERRELIKGLKKRDVVFHIVKDVQDIRKMIMGVLPVESRLEFIKDLNAEQQKELLLDLEAVEKANSNGAQSPTTGGDHQSADKQD